MGAPLFQVRLWSALIDLLFLMAMLNFAVDFRYRHSLSQEKIQFVFS